MTATPPGPGRQPPDLAGQQLAALRAQFPHWDTWIVYTPYDPAGHRTWCARPAGAAVATCHGKEPNTLTCAIRRFTRHLAAAISPPPAPSWPAPPP